MGLFNFKKKKSMDRYDGRPFLKLVDAFVLKCIGHLDKAEEEMLVEMTPKFQEVYNSAGSWDEIVIEQLHFDSNIRQSILEMWHKNVEIAKQNKVELTPMHFTEMFVENNITT
jgi:hypothetical protein